MEIRKLHKNDFPKALLEIPQPPKELWVLGNLPDENYIYLCIVGSRKFTSYGKEACEKLIAGLKGYPIVIVSGFAMGIDTLAHKNAIKNGLKTLVFPGSGLSKEAIYPKTNLNFMNEIIETENCFISEFKPEQKGEQWTFPMRNRLMAGISKAVLVIEATEKSGTMITARLALDYNRDVLALPNSIFYPNSTGTNKLLREGATLIRSSEDLLDALGFEIKKNEDKQAKLFQDLSPEEKQIVEILREPKPRDEVLRELGLGAAAGNSYLTLMEVKGLIKEELGELRLI